MTKYQENIIDEEVTLCKIARIFYNIRELLNFRELRFREFEILNHENQILKIDEVSGEHN